jgi:hypothetical protein
MENNVTLYVEQIVSESLKRLGQTELQFGEVVDIAVKA